MRNLCLIFVVVLAASLQQLSAQCTSCTRVFTNCPPIGGLCNKLDTAYAHHPFDKIVNFYMPHILTSPLVLAQCGGCTYVELDTLTLTSVNGLPTGISYTVSNGGNFYVVNGDTSGCSHFCGTPLVAGLYPVTVYLLTNVTAFGTPAGTVHQHGVSQFFRDTLLVLPDTSAGVSSFTYGNNGSTACDSITVNLNALLTTPQPNFTTYSWNIAGQTSQIQSPGSFTFTNRTHSQPDTFPISLTTTYYNYQVSKVHVNNITGGFCGLVTYCYLTCGCSSFLDEPNPYVVLPSLGYTSTSASSTCVNVNFNNVNSVIPLGTQTIPMQVWAAATNSLCIAQLLGTDTLTVRLGQDNWSDNNTDGYVQFDTVAGTIISDTLYVIVNPTPAIPLIVAADTFCSGDSIIITVDSAVQYPRNFSYQWFRDTIFLSSVTDSAFYTSMPGKFRVILTNPATGCSSQSLIKKETLARSPGLADIVYAGTSTGEFLNPFGAGFTADWYFNGTLVTGQNGQTLPFLGNGVYSAEIYNTKFPSCRVSVMPDSIVSGIDEVASGIYEMVLSPNPNNGKFNLRFSSEAGLNVGISVKSAIGQLIYTRNIGAFNGKFNEELDLGQLGKGVYFISLESSKGSVKRMVIVQ